MTGSKLNVKADVNADENADVNGKEDGRVEDKKDERRAPGALSTTAMSRKGRHATHACLRATLRT